VAGVDDVDPLLLAAVVDREEMAARESEELGDPSRAKRLGDESAAMERCSGAAFGGLRLGGFFSRDA
jgi:hypothetical protein